LVAPGLCTGPNAYTDADTNAGTGANRRMHHAESVRVDGHRHVRERRVAVWFASAGTDSHADADSNADSNAGTGANRRMHHAESVRVDGHRHLREWRVDFCRAAVVGWVLDA
jgi:hypothetical protein